MWQVARGCSGSLSRRKRVARPRTPFLQEAASGRTRNARCPNPFFFTAVAPLARAPFSSGSFKTTTRRPSFTSTRTSSPPRSTSCARRSACGTAKRSASRSSTATTITRGGWRPCGGLKTSPNADAAAGRASAYACARPRSVRPNSGSRALRRRLREAAGSGSIRSARRRSKPRN